MHCRMWTFCSACSRIGPSQSQLNLHIFVVVEVAQYLQLESCTLAWHYELYGGFQSYFASRK
jgi:hypothetical protein